MNAIFPQPQKAVRFNARSFVAFVLSPEAPIDAWLAGLDIWTQNSPGFFASKSVVLNLDGIKISRQEIAGLVASLMERSIRILGIEIADEALLGPELPPLLRDARATEFVERKPTAATRQTDASKVPAIVDIASTALIIDTPIRSGQSITHTSGDLIVLGSVGSGSEVIASGSIHVYGTLRGRAMAGVMGDAKARIFARKNQAELMAINGCYRTAEDMGQALRGKSVQAYLNDDNLLISVIE